jgi:hypothetical protein
MLAMFVLGCGAGSSVSQRNMAPAASAGDEPPPHAAMAQAAPNEAQAVPTEAGRGYLIVEATVEGKSVPAHALLVDDHQASELELGKDISMPAGVRHVEVSLADDSVLIDKPTRQFEVTVEPNQKTRLNAAFPWAKVRLDLMVNGKPQPSTRVKLVREGATVVEVNTGAPMFQISPGDYDADVPVHGKTVRVKGLVFFDGSEQVIPVRAQQ